MKLFDLHSHWGTERGYPLRTRRRARAAAPHLELTTELRHRGRDGRVFPRGTTCASSSISASPKACRSTRCGPITTMRSRRSAAFLTSSSGTGCRSIRAPAATAPPSCGAAWRRARASSALACRRRAWAIRPAIRSTIRSTTCASKRSGPVLVLVGYTGAGAGLPGGDGVKLELCHPRYIDELAIQLSGPHDHRRPPGLAVAGRDDRGDAAQAERLVRAARLVAEILHRRRSSTTFRAGSRTRSCSAPTIRCSPTSGWSTTGGRSATTTTSCARCSSTTPAAVRRRSGARRLRWISVCAARSPSSAARARASATRSRACWPARGRRSPWSRGARSR